MTRLLLVVLGLFGLLAVSCGVSVGPVSEIDGVAATIYAGRCAESSDVSTGEPLVVYSGRSEDLVGPVYEAFACETGTSVSVRWGASTDLALLLAEEGDRTDADIYVSRSPGPTGFLDGEGLLAPLSSDVLGLVDDAHRSVNETWVGFTGRQRVMVFNRDAVTQADLPSSVFALTDEAWRGRVAIPATNGSFVDWFTIFRARYGDDRAVGWLTDMVANEARYYAGNRGVVEAVGRGEIDAGLVNHYYNFQESASRGPSHRAANHVFASSDVGSVVIIPAAAVTAASDNQAAANALVAYLLAEPTQRYFTDTTYEYPLAAGVTPNDALEPLVGLGTGAVSYDALGRDFGETLRLIEATGIQNQ